MKARLERIAQFSAIMLFACVALCGFALPLALFGVVNLLPALFVAVLAFTLVFGLSLMIYIKVS